MQFTNNGILHTGHRKWLIPVRMYPYNLNEGTYTHILLRDALPAKRPLDQFDFNLFYKLLHINRLKVSVFLFGAAAI